MRFILLLGMVFLVGCAPQDKSEPPVHVDRETVGLEFMPLSRGQKTLKSWWVFFDDPVLERFVNSALALNPMQPPDLAEIGQKKPDYEDYRLHYFDSHVDLVEKVSALYIEYRYLQNQMEIAKSYIEDHEVIESRATGRDLLDDARAVDYQKSYVSLQEGLDQNGIQLEKNIRLLTQTTKLLPEYISQVLKGTTFLPASDITPILASPTEVLANAPDIAAARAYFAANIAQTHIFEKSKDIFPEGTLNKFMGVSDDVFLDPQSNLSMTLGSAQQNLRLDFYREQFGHTARYAEAYIDFENILIERMTVYERLFVSFSNLQEQQTVLARAAEDAEKIWYDQRNHNVLDALGARNNLRKVQEAVLKAEYEKIKILLQLYLGLGVI